MSFPSIQFAIFLVVVFAGYYVRPTLRWQNLITVLASYYFYGWWDIRFCSLLFFSSVVDYWAGARIASTERMRVRRFWLGVSLVTNLGLLGFFKYCNFFIDSMRVALEEAGIHVQLSTLDIILPVGISFYTFQTLSYTIDIYRRQFHPARDFMAYLSFVSFFPQLVAGPIERAAHLLPQFLRLRVFSYAEAVAGCQLILWGLFKKVAVADNLAVVVDAAYRAPESASPAHLALATVCFAFQIYCDFSAYSEIASGVARLFGIELGRNFAFPYFSRDLAEFWSRWHISLSRWFRDYVFIPLGGSRCGRARRLLNLSVTFVMSGLWHGAAWTFVCWGALHALLLFPRHWREPSTRLTPIQAAPERSYFWSMGRVFFTFLLVCVGWVLFRADSLKSAMLIYGKVAMGVMSADFYEAMVSAMGEWPRAFAALAAVLAAEWVARERVTPLAFSPGARWMRWGGYSLIFWSLFYLGPTRVEPFIYFQF